MKVKTILRKAAVKSLSKPKAFDLTDEYYESHQDARDNYSHQLLGLDEKSAAEIEIAPEEDKKRKADSDMVLPTHAYKGSDD